MGKTKICSKCGRELTADKHHFYTTSNTKDKLHSACKECEGHKFSQPKQIVKNGFKVCSKCGRELPATLKYFYKDKECLYKVSSICKECRGHSFGNINTVVNGFKVCTVCKRNLPYTKEYYYSSGNDLRTICKECQSKISKNQYKEKIDYKRQYSRNWYTEHLANNETYKIKNRNRAKLYRINNQYTEHYKLMQIVKSQRRRAIKKKLMANYTKKEWIECKNNFDNKCAYCGKPLKNLTQDHIIPVIKGGSYIKQNIIPACKSCNSSKRDKCMETWYKQQLFFSEERLAKIHKWMGVEDNIQQLKII